MECPVLVKKLRNKGSINLVSGSGRRLSGVRPTVFLKSAVWAVINISLRIITLTTYF
jgi:hypothetical protein